MKRSRERRSTRRLAAAPTPPPAGGNGSDEDGVDATQQHEGEKFAASAAAATKRKRVRTRSRTPPPQSIMSDKPPTRAARSRRDEIKEKSQAEKGGGGKREEESSSDGSDEDDEIPISELANRAMSDADESDQVQEQSRIGPQVPTGINSGMAADRAMQVSTSSGGERNPGRPALASSNRPNRVKERDKVVSKKRKLKRPAVDIGSDKDELSYQSKAGGESDDDVLIIDHSAKPKAGAPLKEKTHPSVPYGCERVSKRIGVAKSVKKSADSDKRKQHGLVKLQQGMYGDNLAAGNRKSNHKAPTERQQQQSLLTNASKHSKPVHGRSAARDSSKSNGSEMITATPANPVSTRESKVSARPAKEQVSSSSEAHGTIAILSQKDSVRHSKGQSDELVRKRVRNGSAYADEGHHGIGAQSEGKWTSSAAMGSELRGNTELDENDRVLARKRRIRCDEPPNRESRARQPTGAIDSDSLPSVDSLKTELYMEGIKVHRGSGSERRFADYWDALNRYISSESQAKRFCRDSSSHGIEAELKSFLKTKKLRRLHNRVILAIMQQSMREEVPITMCKRHLPSRWKRQIHLKSSRVELVPSGGSDVSVPTAGAVRSDSKISFQQRKDAMDTQKLREDFGCDTDLWTGFGHRKTPASNEFASSGANSVQRDDCSGRNIAEASLPSANLPGALSIDPTVRGLAGRHGMAVSENAVWLLVVAVRAHATAVLRHTISEMEATQGVQMPPLAANSVESSLSNAMDKANAPGGAHGKTEEVGESGKGGDYGCTVKRRKRSTITVFDMAQALTSIPMLSNGSDNVSKSRVAWERCISAANGTLSAISHPRMDASQSVINESILVASSKVEKALGSGSLNKSQFLAMGAPARTDGTVGSMNASSSVTGTAQGNVQGGKDLSAMRKTAGSVPRGAQTDGKVAENGDASSNRPTSTSPDTARKGRGTGAKNLAAMRAGAKNLRAMMARRTTSTGSKPDEKDASQQEGVKDNDQGQETKDGERKAAAGNEGNK